MPEDAAAAVEALYRSIGAGSSATLIGLFGDFDLAEEVAQETFAAAFAESIFTSPRNPYPHRSGIVIHMPRNTHPTAGRARPR